MSSVAEKLQRKESRSAGAKQVRLKLVCLDFWSMGKFICLIWLCLGIELGGEAVLIWLVLSSTGSFDTLHWLLRGILDKEEFSITDSVGLGQVVLFSCVVAVLNSVT